MLIPYLKYFYNNCKNNRGFSLIELMVVMVIVGILATSVVFMFANPSAKVKTQTFTVLGELNMARSEAVNRNEDVLVEFLEDVSGECQDDILECSTAGNFDGYIICVDLDSVSPPECNSSDTIIKITIFREDVQYYDPEVLPVVPVVGPDRTPGVAPGLGDLINSSGIILDDATPSTKITRFAMEPDGTLEDAITDDINVVMYTPGKTHDEIYGTPYAVKISQGSGSIRISRWTSGAWSTK